MTIFDLFFGVPCHFLWVKPSKKTVPDLWVLRLFEAKDKPKEDQVEMPEVNPLSSELIGNLIFLEAPNFGVHQQKDDGTIKVIG